MVPKVGLENVMCCFRAVFYTRKRLFCAFCLLMLTGFRPLFIDAVNMVMTAIPLVCGVRIAEVHQSHYLLMTLEFGHKKKGPLPAVMVGRGHVLFYSPGLMESSTGAGSTTGSTGSVTTGAGAVVSCSRFWA